MEYEGKKLVSPPLGEAMEGAITANTVKYHEWTPTFY